MYINESYKELILKDCPTNACMKKSLLQGVHHLLNRGVHVCYSYRYVIRVFLMITFGYLIIDILIQLNHLCG